MTTRKRLHWLWSTRLPAVTVAGAEDSTSESAHLPIYPEIVMSEHLPPSSERPAHEGPASPAKALPFYTYFHRQPETEAAKVDTWPAEAFWYSVLFLGCASVALMLWGAYSAMPRGVNPGKSLRAEHTIPKLKSESRTEVAPVQVAMAEPPHLPPPPPVFEPAKVEAPAVPAAPQPMPMVSLPAIPMPVAPTPDPSKVGLPPLPTPEPMKVEPMLDLPRSITPVNAVVPVLPLHQDPMVFVSRANLGDTPMIRNWKTLALYSLLAVAPVTVPAVVVAGGDDGKLQKRLDSLEDLLKTAIKSIEGVSKGVEGVKVDIGGLQTDIAGLKKSSLLLRTDLDGSNVRVENLEKIVGNLQSDVKFLRARLNEPSAAATTPTADKANMDDLRKQLASIEQAILKLKAGETGPSRIALSPPAPTGKVILANMYHEEMLFVINQKTHRVGPGSILPLESIPAGSLTYEVLSPTWGLRARSTTSLPANETFTLTAR